MEGAAFAVLPAYNKNRGLLLELKVAKREEDVEKSAEVAIQQIKEKQYIEGLHRKAIPTFSDTASLL